MRSGRPPMDLHRACLVAIGLYCFLNSMSSCRSSLIGNVTRCRSSEEGLPVYIRHITDLPCITCRCQSRRVVCTKKVCGSLDGCHMILFDKPKGVCCEQCKGCFYRGEDIAHGTEFVDPTDVCKVHICQVGVLMTYKKACHVTCSYPIPAAPGECCPTCPGCSVNGKIYSDGDVIPYAMDKCRTCVCKAGATRCETRACPILNCPTRYQHSEPGDCCATCRGTRKVFRPPRRVCYFQNGVHLNGTKISPDKCTRCICLDSTMQCERQVCPRLQCSPQDTVYRKHHCCLRCKTRWKPCKVHYGKYEHGAIWRSDSCTNCNCDNGVVRCHVEQCNTAVKCPANTHFMKVKGKCCPQCIDEGAVCAVFGDPHYRSFDGRIFSFQGACSYVLTQPCRHGNFSVRVHNDVRTRNGQAWTKSVRVLFKNHKVFLLPKMRIKVNRRRVKAPYEKKGLFTLMQGGHTVVLKTTFGVKIIWDGNSYVEVTVPPSMKGTLCGLCGNYNNDETDDFRGRDNRYYFDASDFGRTWRVGRRRQCRRGRGRARRPAGCRRRGYRRARRACSVLKTPVFRECRSRLNVGPFYRTCIADMCACARGRHCSCASLTAYSDGCVRRGVTVDWRASGLCNGSASCKASDICRRKP